MVIQYTNSICSSPIPRVKLPRQAARPKIYCTSLTYRPVLYREARLHTRQHRLNMSNIDEDSVDEILYLARANEANELEQFLNTLSTQISKSKDQILVEAVDSHSQNTALHYAAANGHNGKCHLISLG